MAHRKPPRAQPRDFKPRHPKETVSGLSEPGHLKHGFPRPEVHERLDRTLKALKPDLVIACYGINCGIYMPLDEERFTKYKQGILRLKKKAEDSGAEIVFMTPPVFDKANPKFNYDDVMAAYAKWLVSKRVDDWRVIDFTYCDEKIARENTGNRSWFQVLP